MTSNRKSFLVLPGQPNNYCIAISLVYIHDCFLVATKNLDTTPVKKVGTVLHSQELERLMACTCMLYGLESMNANMYGWVLYMETMKEENTLSNPSIHYILLLYRIHANVF